MPIIANNVIIVNQTNQGQQANTPVVENTERRKLSMPIKPSRTAPNGSIVVIVNGKEKLMSKNSKYLLDMLTSDIE